jgi:hypothetical protein
MGLARTQQGRASPRAAAAAPPCCPPHQTHARRTAAQIVVPCELDAVLKDFTKAAIRQQPPDLLEFAAT